MTDYYSAWSLWLLIAAVCIAPATVAAGFGRGGFVIAAALCSAFALWSIFPIGFFTWTWPNQTALLSGITWWCHSDWQYGRPRWQSLKSVANARTKRRNNEGVRRRALPEPFPYYARQKCEGSTPEDYERNINGE
jgi:hypothetical protein